MLYLFGGNSCKLIVGVQVWMCGGIVEIATCSHVGHVFRKTTPYSFPGGTARIVNHNNARLAEVWLDQWKEFYYELNPGRDIHWCFSYTLSGFKHTFSQTHKSSNFFFSK